MFNYMLWQETNIRAHMLAFKSRRLTWSCEALPAAAAAASTHSQKVGSWRLKSGWQNESVMSEGPPPAPPASLSTTTGYDIARFSCN